MAFRSVHLPLTPDEARSLKVGDVVLAEGNAAITAGLPTHERIVQYLDEGRPLPIELRGQALFHLGLCGEEQGGAIVPLYVNPTTSTRFSAQLPTIIERLGLTTIAGKGGVDAETAKTMARHGCVYMSMIGGIAPLLTAGITKIVETGWNDQIAQFRLTHIQIHNFGPLTVAVDTHGGNLYGQLAAAAKERLPTIFSDMADQREQSVRGSVAQAGEAPKPSG